MPYPNKILDLISFLILPYILILSRKILKDHNRSPLRLHHRPQLTTPVHTRKTPKKGPRRSKAPSNFHGFFICLFWNVFGSVFPRNLDPEIEQNRSNIDAEMASHVDLIFGSIFSRFWLPTWSLRTSFGASGLAPNGFFRIFRKPHIGCDFGVNLAAFSLPKSMKIHPKNDPKMHQFCDRFGDGFFIDLESILKANLGTCWPLKSIRNCPRRPQDAPKTRLGAIVSIFRRPDRILAPSWLDFGRFWASFLKVLGAEGPPRPPK